MRRNTYESTRTGRKKPGRHEIQRSQSGLRLPPGNNTVQVGMMELSREYRYTQGTAFILMLILLSHRL